ATNSFNHSFTYRLPVAVDIRNEVLRRVYLVLFFIVLIAVVVFLKAVKISVTEGDKWREKGKDLYVSLKPVNAERGNILTEDGSLLATSLPFFEIRFDPNSTGMAEKDFYDNLDSLAFCLSTFVDKTWTVGGWRQRLLEEKDKGQRYMLISSSSSYTETELIRSFPLFNKGQYGGGLQIIPNPKRERPFKGLAHRTIGYTREGYNPVGLEGFFNGQLVGKQGAKVMFKAPGNIWLPMSDLTEIEPKKGDDIVTTLDVNLLDITNEALLRGLNHHEAESGTAIIMEVKTGAIKAITNLGKIEKGYFEKYNYAVGEAYEPGSTFKIASLMALMEDGYVNLYDSIDIEKGKHTFYEEEMVDASRESFSLDTTTVMRALEISSNVGIAKLVTKYYGNDDKGQARQFIKRLKQFKLHLPVNIEIQGEANPYIKEAYSKEDKWSGITLPWMSIGYEVLLTPVQLLTFFNTIANDGRMMKPYLVSEVQQFGTTVKKIKPTVVDKSIASKKTIDKVKLLLESVVENGTAHKLKTNKYRFAGKTGTAQIDYRKFKRKEGMKYRASFAGYFPADNPVYTCVVVVTNPTKNGIYGGDVAGPIFREIADKCFAQKIELHSPLNNKPKPRMADKYLPSYQVAQGKDLAQVLDRLQLPYINYTQEDHWGVLTAESDTLNILTRQMAEKTVPNVVGMGLKDALYVLENLGLQVKVSGVGRVRKQSIIPGTRVQGQTVKLTLR
ncbi:MAG: cell division protein FtsI (penicillin-binding protein 3), partial [Flavobacteriales bacterium]